jgi:hypothetical protein
MLAATVLATGLVTYLSGYAQMTHAGYQRVKLQTEERNLRAEQNALLTKKNEQVGKDYVEQWAVSHGFVKPATPPLVLQCMSLATAREGR